MLKLVDGKKTHIGVGIFVAAVVAETWLGIDVPNFHVPEGEAVNWILGALGISTLRDAIRKGIDAFTAWRG